MDAKARFWHPRRRRPIRQPGRVLVVLAFTASAVLALPIAAIAVLALAPAPGIWQHLLTTTLPHSVAQTLMLMAGVAILTAITGAGTAWLVTMYRFPGRNAFDWLLILPLALPAYIAAYSYGEFFDYTGAPQRALRWAFGFTSFRDYWFPNVRTLGGAVFVMASVLYPYVYLTARAAFALQAVRVLEVARTLGRSGTGALMSVALPMARPALAAGVSLALMECLNDIGAVEYLGVQTLTLSIYAAWIQRASLAGAAQLALVTFVFVAVLLLLERYGRRNQRFASGGRALPVPEDRLTGATAWAATMACVAPLTAGFIIPVTILAQDAFAQGLQAEFTVFASAARNSLLLAVMAAAIAVVVALLLSSAMRIGNSPAVAAVTRAASLGYAIPGTVIAVGVVVPLAGVDNALDAFTEAHFGVKTGLLLSGSAFALLFAYTIRFLAVALGPIETGWQRLSPNLDAAARTLGASPLRMLTSVHLPLLRPALVAAALLVFVDAMKELPATILLRPFNFETLATQIYTYASQEQFSRSALAALMIVVVGMVPLLLLHRILAASRPGAEKMSLSKEN